MKIPHVTIHVKDMEKSLAFYQEVAQIGIQIDLRPMGKPFVFLADDMEATRIELIEDAEHAYQGSGISVGFRCESAEKEMERLKALGYETSDMVSPNPKTKFFFVTDPDGFKVQIID